MLFVEIKVRTSDYYQGYVGRLRAQSSAVNSDPVCSLPFRSRVGFVPISSSQAQCSSQTSLILVQ